MTSKMSCINDIRSLSTMVAQELREARAMARNFESQGFVGESQKLSAHAAKVEQLIGQLGMVAEEQNGEFIQQLEELGKSLSGPGYAASSEELWDAPEEMLMTEGKAEVKIGLLDNLQQSLTQGAKVGLAAGTTDMVAEVTRKHLPEPVRLFLEQNPAAEGLVRLAIPAILMVVADKFGDQIPQSAQISSICSLAVEGAARDGVQTALHFGLPLLADVAAIAASSGASTARQIKDNVAASGAPTPAATALTPEDDIDIMVEGLADPI